MVCSELQIGDDLFTFHEKQRLKPSEAEKMCRKEGKVLAPLHDKKTLEQVSSHIRKCFSEKGNWHVGGLNKKKSFSDGVEYKKDMGEIFVRRCQPRVASKEEHRVILNPKVKKLSILGMTSKGRSCGAVKHDKKKYICMSKVSDEKTSTEATTSETTQVHTTSTESSSSVTTTNTKGSRNRKFSNEPTTVSYSAENFSSAVSFTAPKNSTTFVKTAGSQGNDGNQGNAGFPLYLVCGGVALALVVMVVTVMVVIYRRTYRKTKRKLELRKENGIGLEMGVYDKFKESYLERRMFDGDDEDFDDVTVHTNYGILDSDVIN